MNKKRLFLVVLLIPIVVISFIYKTNYFFHENIKVNKNQKEKNIIIRLKDNNKINKINLNDYLIGVVGCEIPASFNLEALKAQAIASRTYAIKRINKNKEYDIENSINNQCYYSNEELKKRWKDRYEDYYLKIKNAVYETNNEIITYNDEPITALFFAMSNGYTEDSQKVFKSSKPYLKQVDSKWETKRKDFINKKILTEKEFKQIFNIKENINIKILSRTSSNRINTIMINNKTYKGTEIRKKLNLKSTDFKIEKRKNKIIITTKGYGHGVGMSQYGANGMASEGYNYKDILSYYYKNIKVKKV